MSNKEIIVAHYEAGKVGDLPGMLAPLAEDVAWTEAAGFPCAGTYIGPAAVAENVFAVLARDWDGFKVEIDDVHDAGDTVFGVGTYSGSFKSTGKPFRARVVHVWRLKDDKVVGFEQITDTAEVAAAMS
jgi:ketosteroid isomerase-like protein